MSKWTDPSATASDDNHELRELRWRIGQLHKQLGRQGETIHRLRGELADVRQLNSKVERGQIRNLEASMAWRDEEIARLRTSLTTARECNQRQRERLTAALESSHARTDIAYPGFARPVDHG